MEWQTIDSCPKDPWSDPFLVYDANADKRKIKIAVWEKRDYGGYVYDVYGGVIRHATHWMALPDYPNPLPKRSTDKEGRRLK